jgi:hypothetical protein
MEVSGQLHAPDALPPGNRPWYPLDRRLGELRSRSVHCGEEKNLAPPDNLFIFINLFAAFSMTLSVTQITQRRMVG